MVIKMEKICPVEKIMKILGMKWNMLILKHLNERGSKKRFNILLEELKPISSRTLSKRLKELEKLGLVKREKFDEIPPRVEYSLTPSGLEIIKCFKPLSKLAKKFGDL
jgi:DNA-binding HxlR family transcriptional regulator